VTTVLNATTHDKLTDYVLSRRLHNLQQIYPFVNHIIIYNATLGRFVGTTGVSTHPTEAFAARANANSPYFEVFPSNIHEISDNTVSAISPVNSLVFLFRPQISHAKSIITISVSEQYFCNLFQIAQSHAKHDIFLLSDSNVYLAQVRSELFMQSPETSILLDTIQQQNCDTGYFFLREHNIPMLCSFARVNDLGSYLVSIQPRADVVKEITYMLWLTVFMALLIFLFGFPLALLMVEKIYSPIRAILSHTSFVLRKEGINHTQRCNEFSIIEASVSGSKELKESLLETRPLLRQRYLQALLLQAELHPHEKRQLSDGTLLQQTTPYSIVVVVRFDHYTQLMQTNSEQDLSLLRFALCNIVQELIDEQFVNELILCHNADFTFLCAVHQPSDLHTLATLLQSAQQIFQQHFSTSFSCGVGHAVAALQSISLSYQTALHHLSLRLFSGAGSVISATDEAGEPGMPTRYPVESERLLLDALRLASDKDAYAHLHDFFTALPKNSARFTLYYCNQLNTSILKSFDFYFDSPAWSETLSAQITEDLSRYETLCEIESALCALCTQICTLLRATNSSATEKAIGDAVRFAQQNYADPNLCIDSVASLVHLSVPYLGRVFYNKCGVSFSTYLNNIRMDHAKELLAATELSTADIASRVGVYNQTYFFTLFKKAAGCTPTQYRKLAVEGRKKAADQP
ncbi:MAG: helix-turn-helix domain-containing protein, partial [Ruthenibacterium sp.]